MATPQLRRLFLSVSPTSAYSACSANSDGGKRKDGAAETPLRSISSPTFVFRPDRSNPAEQKRGRLCGNGDLARSLRPRSFAFRLNEQCHQARNRGEALETARRIFRDRRCFSVQLVNSDEQITAATLATWPFVQSLRRHCFFSVRAANSAEQITEVNKLTRPPVQFLRHHSFLLRPRGGFWGAGKKGRSSEMALSCELAE